MPAAKTRDELIAVTNKEWAKLSILVNEIDADMAGLTDRDDISIKDILGHRGHWIDLFLGWYKDGQAGRKVYFPAKGFKWNQLKSYNAALRQAQAGISWPQIQFLLENSHSRLMAFVSAHSDNDLYGGPMKGAYNDWTTGRWAEAAGASHFRSAAKYIRKRLREAV